ncbi:MAG: NADH:ubiquinone oxidoreductase [Porphyromonadaceae bacterium CG2_30_38_12]|nr:MAG: NADH:ubiquinone oxidoreductase [Porphyromonadaceae bacterium CG2_30_38_12]
MLHNLKILFHNGKQFIPDPTTVQVPGIFRGRPIITAAKVDADRLKDFCPTNAIGTNPVTIDLGKCTFCGDCARRFPEKFLFTKDYKISSNERDRLIIKEGEDKLVEVNPDTVGKEIHSVFGRSLKLRQISAGGDNSCEWELGAANNVQFDMSRYGIDFVASPRHADGIVITGPITANMARALQICYDATPEPKIIVIVGTDAISGGIFADSPAIDRSFLDKYHVDLYIAGNPAHPLTIINGLLDLTRKKRL